MAEAAREALTGAGHEVVVCLGVAEALSLCQERRPDLALTELYLPEGSGLDFLEKLGRLDPAPPAVMVTGCGREEAAARALRLGARDYLVKTEAYLEELPGLVRRILDEWAARQAGLEAERLRRRLEAQNELAGWLAHNFKNILAASIGYLNLVNLRDPGQDRERQEEYLEGSRRSQESAVELLERLIRLTEAEDGEPERIIVAEVVSEAWESAQARTLADLAARGQEPAAARALLGRVAFLNSTRRLEPLTLVRADLFSIMEALLRNALESVLASPDPRILVAGEMNDRRLDLTVRDNGRGMDENVLRHALEPFFSTKGEVGVGLGLSLAHSLVHRQGGELSLTSAPGAGAAVKISLPL